MSNRVLLVEDDPALRFSVGRYLMRQGFEVVEAGTCATARELFASFQPEIVVTDYRLPDGEALELITTFRLEKPELPIVVCTGYGTIELAVNAMRTGACNLFTKPVDLDLLVEEIRRALEPRPAPLESGTMRVAPRRSASRSMAAIHEDVRRLKDVDCPIVIQGETGTGKTMLARSIHDTSRRARKPFIELNCAGLARDLLESELFGHERGAFTSAHATKPGMLDLADGGTLFLDEIGDIDLAVQAKMLKAIEEKRFRRMGGAQERSVDVRILAATHRDLRAAVRANQFRSDLYYRLSTVTVTMPSLRDRRADIPALAADLLVTITAKIGRNAPTLSPDAEDALAAHSWPGNIRELRNVLERAVHLAPTDVIFATDLRVEESLRSDPPPKASTLWEVEREHVARALDVHGHVGEAAKSLGISRSSMYLKLKEYGIAPSRRSAPRINVKTGKGP